MKKFITISVITVIFLALAFAGALLILRMEEDSWICEDNQWVKHGNPINPPPNMTCGNDSIDIQLPAIDENNSEENDNIETEEPIVGGDQDEHGCIGSAGYTWCPEKNKCLRIWEEDCPSIPKTENN